MLAFFFVTTLDSISVQYPAGHVPHSFGQSLSEVLPWWPDRIQTKSRRRSDAGKCHQSLILFELYYGWHVLIFAIDIIVSGLL